MAKAEQFLALADLAASEAGLQSAEASNLVEAGIAASDVICCVLQGLRSADGRHGAAVDLLRVVDAESARRLQGLLSIKSDVQYGTGDPSDQRMTAARRAAAHLVGRARQVLEQA